MYDSHHCSRIIFSTIVQWHRKQFESGEAQNAQNAQNFDVPLHFYVVPLQVRGHYRNKVGTAESLPSSLTMGCAI